MEGKASSSRGKRPFPEDDADDNKPPMKKRVRFPKGKKLKEENVVVAVMSGPQEAPKDLNDPKIASKERSKRRSQMTTELFHEEDGELPATISDAEEQEKYEDDGNFVEDGIQIEPFNLNQEREEGYFDEDGNFVEYKNENEKDAWLDSVEVDTRFAGQRSTTETDDETTKELSAEHIAKIKRRIANLLQPGETVLKALRRLKGTGNDKKGKMPEETKILFDQLTEDSMKLMDNGEYDVYHDRQETFEREAEGYEKLACATDMFADDDEDPILNDPSDGKDLISDSTAPAHDMFAEDDEGPNSDQVSSRNNLTSGSIVDLNSQPSSSESSHTTSNGDLQNDYVYDESSGYYYSSTLGYYYDPASTLYCCATSGKWYSYNESTGAYDEFQGESTAPVS